MGPPTTVLKFFLLLYMGTTVISLHYEPSFIKRLEFGAAFKKNSVLSMSRLFWEHTIAIDLLPYYNFSVSPPLCQREPPAEDKDFIQNLYALFGPTFDSYTGYCSHLLYLISKELQTVSQMIPLMTNNTSPEPNPQRPKRSLFGSWSGEVFSKLFHLATLDHVKVLMQHIEDLESHEEVIPRLAIFEKELHSYQTHNAEFEKLMEDGLKQNAAHLNEIYNELRLLSS